MAKTLDYDFTSPLFNGTTGIEAQTGPDLTVTRASDATVMDYFNVLKTVNDNEPRFTGGRRVENICKQSADFSTTWTVTGYADPINVNQATAPDGTLSADQLIDDARGTAPVAGACSVSQNVTVANSTAYTYSAYLKADQLSWAALRAGGFTTPTTSYSYFNLATGALGTVDAQHTAGIEDAGNGWYRCWITFTTDATDTGGNVSIYPAEADLDTSVDLDGTSSIFVWGAQLENVSGQDDPAPSAYIATTTAAKAQWYATKRRTNLLWPSEDYSTDWTKAALGAGSNPVLVTADYSTVSGVTLDRYTFECGGTASTDRSRLLRLLPMKLNQTYTASVWLATVSGTVDINMYGSNTYASGVKTLTTTPQRFSVSALDASADGTHTMLELRASGDVSGAAAVDILIGGAQCEDVTTYDDPAATAYIATTDSVASSSFDTAITPTGLLVEEARTNICTYSEDLGASWSSLKADITETNSATAPDGTATADKLKDDSSGGSQAVTVYKGITTVTSTTYTFSTYAKADGVSWLYLYVAANASEVIHAYYDLTNGVVGATLGADNVDQGIEDVGNGWFRCWITYTAADNGQQPAIRLADSDGDSSVDCTTGASSTFLWGMSLEAGSFPTSYIPTTTASVTRNKDNVSTTDLTWYNAAEGSVYTHANTFDAVGDVGIFSLNDSTTHRYYLYAFNDDVRAVIVSPGTNGILLSTANEYASKAFVRSSLGLAANDMALYGNGTLVGTTASVDMPTPVTFAVGSFLGANFLNGHIARIVYYDERLDDATLEDLSNGTFPSAQFPGTVAGDGGHIWPPRANDPRWTQIISDSGITASGNFIDDVHAALEALGSTTGQLDDLWKKVKAANSVTDTSEPYLY